jgi:hypothetical protein
MQLPSVSVSALPLTPRRLSYRARDLRMPCRRAPRMKQKSAEPHLSSRVEVCPSVPQPSVSKPPVTCVAAVARALSRLHLALLASKRRSSGTSQQRRTRLLALLPEALTHPNRSPPPISQPDPRPLSPYPLVLGPPAVLCLSAAPAPRPDVARAPTNSTRRCATHFSAFHPLHRLQYCIIPRRMRA